MMNVFNENGKVGAGIVPVFEPSIPNFQSGTEAELRIMAKRNDARVALGFIFNVHTPVECPPAVIDRSVAGTGLSQKHPIAFLQVLVLSGPRCTVPVHNTHLHVPDLTAYSGSGSRSELWQKAPRGRHECFGALVLRYLPPPGGEGEVPVVLVPGEDWERPDHIGRNNLASFILASFIVVVLREQENTVVRRIL